MLGQRWKIRKDTATGRTWLAMLPTSVFAGAAATVTFYTARKALVLLGHLDPFENRMEDEIWLAFPAFVLAGSFIGARLSVQRQSADLSPARLVGLVAANGGILAGVIIWLAVEELMFKRFGVFPVYEEHNLFPIEIIILWVLAAGPLILGMWFGYVVSGLCRRRDAR
jgi:hypothetical protein